MADSRGPRDDVPTSPVVRHGRVPDPSAVSPVQGARARPPRRGPGEPPRSWPGPVLRRDRDPLPDGYASRRGGAPGRGGLDRDTRAVADLDDPEPPLPDLPDDLPDVDPALLDEADPPTTPEAASPLRGPEPGPLSAVRRKLGKALVPGERVLVAQTRHPIVLAEPVLTSLLVLLGVAAASPYLGALDVLRTVLMVGWLVLAVRALWVWLQWANDYFVVTDRRLIRLHGIVDVQRDMMPLTKVTDMAFERPFWGRPFNYGRFVLESAGQDQSLRVISYVRDPENVDAIIGRQIFARPPFQAPRSSYPPERGRGR